MSQDPALLSPGAGGRTGEGPEGSFAELDEGLARRLASTGYASGDLRRDLYDWMGRENVEERWREDRLDPVVLQHLRATTS
jgi:hypothetical protein